MLERLSPARRNLALTALLALVLWFAWSVRWALNPLLLALLFAYILHPLVLKLERRGWSRKVAVNVIFCGVALCGALLTLAVVLQARGLWNEISSTGGSIDRLQSQFTDLVNRFEAWLKGIGLEPEALLGSRTGGEAGAPSKPLVEELFERARVWLTSSEGREGAAKASVQAAEGAWLVVARVFGSLFSALTLVFLVPLYTWFLLFELERISSFVTSYIPLGQRAQWSRIGEQMAEMLGAFFRGRLIVCLLKGALMSVTLLVLGVPYALLAGMFAGALSLIPVVGPGVGYLFVLVLALLKFDPTGAAWRTAVVFVVGEMGEGYVLMPKVLGERLGLHPIVVLASLMICGSALGMFGLLLALPLTATIVILTRELVLPALRAFAEGRGTKGAAQ
ncbi:MAG: AI-2E family transporter [Planctomycetes bacterium]|nr:AI-2E family transporter [Planctomycetota bacterium]